MYPDDRQCLIARSAVLKKKWTGHLAPARSPRLLFVLPRRVLYWKLQHLAPRLSTQISLNTPATKSNTPRSPNTAPATQNDSHDWWMSVTFETSFTMRGATSLILQRHQIPHMPHKMCCYFTGTVTFLSCYLTELLLAWAVTLLSCYFYWAALLLYWAVSPLSCYFTELLLDWAVTGLSCYFTELLLLLSCSVTLLSCFFTELFLYWAATLLNCYFTELLLDWVVTLLSCYFTEPLLHWAVTLLSCYFAGLFACLNLRNSEVSQLNFLWWKIAMLNPWKQVFEQFRLTPNLRKFGT